MIDFLSLVDYHTASDARVDDVTPQESGKEYAVMWCESPDKVQVTLRSRVVLLSASHRVGVVSAWCRRGVGASFNFLSGSGRRELSPSAGDLVSRSSYLTCRAVHFDSTDNAALSLYAFFNTSKVLLYLVQKCVVKCSVLVWSELGLSARRDAAPARAHAAPRPLSVELRRPLISAIELLINKSQFREYSNAISN
ncbi:hypothetical protein B5X24_HaOG204005 [Helicoverpa armigera]|uniref:Uncharacterized protein n=1 Tax=Helicoverpa armigera TaxID=29058 RepID=A0A2W1BPK0_HELAM|nr:hypothetical protein B5X24_HaOG204005 [Helicoverpa armigera]